MPFVNTFKDYFGGKGTKWLMSGASLNKKDSRSTVVPM
jgi:hypothetical protein